MNLPKPHVRITAATLRKEENFRKLIAGLKQGGMILADMCDLLDFSPSGGRKYLRQLVSAGVVYAQGHDGARKDFIGFVVWALVSEEAADAFIAAIAQVRPHEPPARKKVEAEPTPGIHVYMARDDTSFTVPRAVVVPRRDDLVAALFGAVGAAA